MTKPSLKYRIISAYDPGSKTKGGLLRPIIVERDTYGLDQVVDYALNAGYVRGQFHDMRGALNGFIEAIQQLGKDGKAVNLNNWLRVHGELTGSVDATRQLGAKNEYHVAITAMKDLKRGVDEFSWTNAGDTGVRITVDHLMGSGSAVDGVIAKGTAIIATGKNLMYQADLLDKVTIDWMDGTTAHSEAVAPATSDIAHMEFAWPTSLDTVAAGTELKFTFALHGGVKDGAVTTLTKTAKIAAA